MMVEGFWEPHRNPSRALLDLKHPHVVRMTKFAAAVAAVGLLGMALNGASLSALSVAAASLATLGGAAIVALSYALANKAEDDHEHALWRGVLGALPQAVCVVDHRGRTVRVTPNFRRLFPANEHAPLTELRRRLSDRDPLTGPVARLAGAASRGQVAVEDVEAAADRQSPAPR